MDNAMNDVPLRKVKVTQLRRIPTPDGEVRHCMRAQDEGFAGFGEVYVTEVYGGATKGWKRHREMTMNLVVLRGTVRFIVHDGTREGCQIHVLSAEDGALYARLTVPPGLWMAFQGVAPGSNLLLNIASHAHDPAEADRAELADFAASLPSTDAGR